MSRTDKPKRDLVVDLDETEASPTPAAATEPPRGGTLETMIAKRHDGPAWIVIQEVANSTGGNKKRAADAVAIGLWPSRGYEIHGYEIKRSRGDVQKELADPSKADAVGKFCDFWWLVISDLKIIDGLVIPEAWGILVPKIGVLRVHRKAPKRDATPITRGFFAALVRTVTEQWVPKHEHEALRETQRSKLLAELERDRQWTRERAEADLDALKMRVDLFEKASGVEIGGGWRTGDIGAAVRTVLDIRGAGTRDDLDQRARALDNVVRQYEHSAENARRAAEAIRNVLGDSARGEQRELPLEVPALPDRNLHG